MSEGIQVKNIEKRYGSFRALSGLSVTFSENRIYGLLGRNGAGKTTLLNLISNRIFLDEGEIVVDGEKAQENDRAQSNVFYVGEVQLVPEETKVMDYFKLTKRFYPGFDMDYAMRLSSEYGLATRKSLKHLSTGYGTIAKLIVALASDAKYLLLDEPVLGLDANHREMFYRELLVNYAENPRTIIISTHLIEEISSIIEQVVIIKAGKILLDAPAEEVRSMGYSVAGKGADVDAFCAGRKILSEDTLGGLKTACILGKPENVPETLQTTALDMQKFFVHLTNA